jgi:hypothetical protein
MSSKIISVRYSVSSKKGKKYEVKYLLDDGTEVWKEVSWIEYEMARINVWQTNEELDEAE